MTTTPRRWKLRKSIANKQKKKKKKKKKRRTNKKAWESAQQESCDWRLFERRGFDTVKKMDKGKEWDDNIVWGEIKTSVATTWAIRSREVVMYHGQPLLLHLSIQRGEQGRPRAAKDKHGTTTNSAEQRRAALRRLMLLIQTDGGPKSMSGKGGRHTPAVREKQTLCKSGWNDLFFRSSTALITQRLAQIKRENFIMAAAAAAGPAHKGRWWVLRPAWGSPRPDVIILCVRKKKKKKEKGRIWNKKCSHKKKMKGDTRHNWPSGDMADIKNGVLFRESASDDS
ncbi:hypothetical protein DAPPUDRAFT_233016 [Daphnia pulex]|uniref:Uncharacterized protein n=1 Tax=Daphnia pulex TaxID=6669 RepID=E9FSY5_DAPPU|nr:hypothetical protein DAPPUDRAFT_233016 [Daphnia pulex]|eukprot:EFX89734.1 hypothetical protein DAPPUDRAFT_233016 [Daphnia pulex]